MSAFNARDRVKLTEELRTELYDLIHEHGRMVDLTLPEVLGVLEILKIELVAEHMETDEGEDE